MFGGGGDLRRGDEAIAATMGGYPDDGPDRADRRDAREHVPRQRPVSFLISIVGVVHLHRPDRLGHPAHPDGDLAVATGSMEKGAVIGALILYLDFINLFLFLLRLTGGTRN